MQKIMGLMDNHVVINEVHIIRLEVPHNQWNLELRNS